MGRIGSRLRTQVLLRLGGCAAVTLLVGLVLAPAAFATDSPDLTITKTSDAAGTLSVGDRFSYTLTVSNVGTATAHKVAGGGQPPAGPRGSHGPAVLPRWKLHRDELATAARAAVLGRPVHAGHAGSRLERRGVVRGLGDPRRPLRRAHEPGHREREGRARRHERRQRGVRLQRCRLPLVDRPGDDRPPVRARRFVGPLHDARAQRRSDVARLGRSQGPGLLPRSDRRWQRRSHARGRRGLDLSVLAARRCRHTGSADRHRDGRRAERHGTEGLGSRRGDGARARSRSLDQRQPGPGQRGAGRR